MILDFFWINDGHTSLVELLKKMGFWFGFGNTRECNFKDPKSKIITNRTFLHFQFEVWNSIFNHNITFHASNTHTFNGATQLVSCEGRAVKLCAESNRNFRLNTCNNILTVAKVICEEGLSYSAESNRNFRLNTCNIDRYYSKLWRNVSLSRAIGISDWTRVIYCPSSALELTN